MAVADETGVLAGAVYDGDGRLVLGSGPTFSLGLVTDCAFQAVLHNLDELGNTIEPEMVNRDLTAMNAASGTGVSLTV